MRRDGLHEEPERLLVGEVAQGFFNAVVEQARAQGLLSNEHFTVDAR